MGTKRAQSAGGALLLSEQAVSGLHASKDLAEVVEALRRQETGLAPHLPEANSEDVRLACQACVNEMLGSTCAAMDAHEFARQVCALRGAPRMAMRRKEAREVARAYALLSTGAPPAPAGTRDFEALWEIAQEAEPRLSKDFPPSGIRHCGSRINDENAPGGCLRLNTAPENIERELQELVAFLQDHDLPDEVRAAAAYASCMLTHPFVDGNGHMGRLLMLTLMAPRYSLLTNVCFARMLTEKKRNLGDAVQLMYEGESGLAGFCLYALGLLLGAQREALDLLTSPRR